uniref:Larval serum protein 1 gamma chain n=1 Tax=Stomoxys calcitrans TaxID=35570 RepID=A0A1I8P2W0_STOCA
MKLALAFLAIVALVTANAIPKKELYADKDFLLKQKFLFEIVYRVEDPLMFEDYIKLGKSFTYNKQDYEFPEHYDASYMSKYYQAYQHGVTLPKGEFFGALVDTHMEQLYGLTDFLLYAKTWDIFQRNVCWARLYANEGMFVQALTLAVMHRPDFKDLVLPAIYEIFPQYFLNSKFVYQAEKFDYDVWSKYIMYEKEYKDVVYTDYTKYFKDNDRFYKYFYTRDWKVWQWWKIMGLDQHWYANEQFIIRDNAYTYSKDSKYLDIMKDVKMFWMPVDYTRDIEFFNRESKISYFTEDLEWNAFWYYFNLGYAAYLKGAEQDRRGEYYIYCLEGLLKRYYLERLSNGFGEIPEFSFLTEVEYGYDPQLMHYNGEGYSYRKNYYDIESFGNFEYVHKIKDFFERLDGIITQGYYVTADGKKFDMHKPQAIEHLGDMLQGNVDVYDKYFFRFWYLYAHMYFGHADESSDFVLPNVFLNYETMLRDPLFYQFYKKVLDVFHQFYEHVEPYTKEELQFPGVEIEDVTVNNLVTYFDLVDFDVTNLLNDKMTFVDGQFVWDKTLLARQVRLNHKNVEFYYTIKSEKEEKVVVRVFFGPKYDEFGRIIPLARNHKNFIEMDNFVHQLKAGKNLIKRSTEDFFWLRQDHTTYTEMYKFVMSAYEGNFEYPLGLTEPLCSFPDRLLLPQGWPEGMPMQFFFFVYPYVGSLENNTYESDYGCSIRHGIPTIDDKAFGYPMDRKINEFEFYVPNMYFKDVKIYHENALKKLYGEKYEHFGT